MDATLNSKVPSGRLESKWRRHRDESKLVSPAKKRKFDILVVGSGLAGASAAASLAELGYNVKCFCFQDSPRRAHSIAAQGGINAAKNYQNDGDSVFRLFYDTIKGGDFRSREANVYRLAEVSVEIIDQCVAQGVPFAREYGGLLSNRSFGGAQVSRTFYARGQTAQQLLLGSEASSKEALQKIPVLREEFWQNVNVLGEGAEFNQALEQAGRVADFLEFAELMCEDALERNESCGAHFRTEYQTEEGDALRNDAEFRHVAAWQYNGANSRPTRNVEPLEFEEVKLAQRSYK